MTQQYRTSATTAHANRSGLTVIEVLVSALLVGVVVVAALNISSSSMRAQMLLGERARALLMAQDLLVEATGMPYRDSDGTSGFGPEANEGTTTRATFDDVDDYDGWTGSPPTQKNGSPLAAPSNWERTVSVQYVDPGSVSTMANTDLGAKRITVRVKRESTELAKLTTVAFQPVE